MKYRVRFMVGEILEEIVEAKDVSAAKQMVSDRLHSDLTLGGRLSEPATAFRIVAGEQVYESKRKPAIQQVLEGGGKDGD